MDVLSAIILAIIQGITEWLPISSSGHLVIAQQVFGLESSILYDAFLHVATLLAVLIVFRKDILNMAKALLTWNTNDENFKLFWLVVLGTIPIGLAGLLFKDFIEAAFSSTLIVALSLLLTGTLLWFTKYEKKKSELTTKNAILIGLAQIIALLPGVSRSGTTISTGLLLGLKREAAARFAFLLFIPAVLGAGLLQGLTADWSTVQPLPFLLGLVVAIIVSIIALSWLVKIVKKGKLYYFSWYCWFIGLLLLILFMFSTA